MSETPLILKFKDLEIDFTTVKHAELLEKLFKSQPVSYLPTVLYFELFNIAYDNFINKKDFSFSFIITYKELEEKFNRQVCTLSNALRSLEEAKLIVKDRIMVANDQRNSRFKWKYVLNIKLKFSASMQKNLQASMELKNTK